MQSDVERIFDAKIKEIFAQKPEIKKFLLAHERKKMCLDNLCYQIRLAELGRGGINTETYRDLIESVCGMFMRAAISAKEQELLTDNEKKLRITQADRQQELRKMVEDAEKKGI